MHVTCFVAPEHVDMDIDDEPSDKIKGGYHSAVINRTRLYSCDKVVTLYTLSSAVRNKTNQHAPRGCER